MTTHSKLPCRHLLRSSYEFNEIGGVFPTVIPNAKPNCEIKLLDNASPSMEWKKCEQTLDEGPCWQYPYSSMTFDEWNNFVKQRIGK